MSFMFTHHKNSITFFVSKLFWSCFLFGWRHLVKLCFFLRKHYILENLFSIQRYCFKKMFVCTIFFFIYVFFPVWHIMIPRLMEKIMFLEHLLFSEFSFKENLSNNERIPSPFLPMHTFCILMRCINLFFLTQKEHSIVFKFHSFLEDLL